MWTGQGIARDNTACPGHSAFPETPYHVQDTWHCPGHSGLSRTHGIVQDIGACRSVTWHCCSTLTRCPLVPRPRLRHRQSLLTCLHRYTQHKGLIGHRVLKSHLSRCYMWCTSTNNVHNGFLQEVAGLLIHPTIASKLHRITLIPTG